MAIVQRCAVWNILWALLVPVLARLDDTKSIKLSATSACPAPCFCYSSTINCANNELLQLPADTGGRDFKALDVSSNVLTRVPSTLHQLLPSLEKLDLSHNHIVTIESDDFVGLKYLKYLDLSNNRLTVLSSKSFGSLPGLRELHLNRNRLSEVPTRAFSVLTDLNALSLGGNLISSLPANGFFKLNNLTILDLKNNHLGKLDDAAFAGLGMLSVLKLSGNRLKEVRNGVLQRAPALERIVLRGNPITAVGRDAFSRLPQLEELELPAVRGLTDFPNLNGTRRIDDLRIYGTQMTSVPDDLCVVMTDMKRMYLPSNKLKKLPKLEACTKLRLIDLSYNEIESISGSLFRSQVHLQDLLLNHNRISEITADAFIGLTKLQILNLRQNRISSIAETAFQLLPNLHRLNLNGNSFPRLPSVGLVALTHLHCSGIREMREFPSPEEFPSLRLVEVSYAYHCCQFGRTGSQLDNGNHTLSKVTEKVYFPSHDQFDFSRWRQNVTDIWSDLHNGSGKLDDFGRELLEDFGSEYPEHLPAYVQEAADVDNAKTELQPIGHVICTPEPSPFMPCEDLFDWWSLRCGVWVVFLLALLGNGVVVFVLIFARSKLDVPRFLVCNLAAADFFMGLYLGFLAVVDATTMGEFRKYAIAWQMSVGCQMAGFFGVFSSELSVFTLAVITMERNYAITHAMHLNKRLSLRRAGYIMVGGWLFAMVTALLPLFGISDYRRFAVCLPFQTAGAGIGYVVFLMLINGFAFVILMGCYWKMYCAIRGSQAWNSNDSRIAKRMALLVFSDFLCWAPIAFFVLSSAAGVHLIGLSGAKVFTVFVLPFNSCCNPFLYAILTKQFKKDCVTLCKAIEESRVSRGIGRGRHSSNFSNRHTPANTNSLGERTSKGSIRCRCSQALVLDPTQKKTYRRWKKFRAIWCPAMRKERGVDSGNNYAFQIAEIQKDQEKSKRNPSFSSDNFSSSRSDSLRTHTRTVKLRRNSWSVTRKPSQDSNLSTSRNDSSITAGSQTTQSWQMSRSSVSSDTSNPFLQRALSNAAEFSDGSLRSRPLNQQTHHDPDHMCIAPQNSSRNLLFRYSLKKQASSGILKNKPPLTRQSAVSQDVAMVAGQIHKIGCPLHSGGAPASVLQTRHRSIRDKLLQSGHESTPSFERNLVNDTKQLSRISAMMDAKTGTFSSSTAAGNDVYVDFMSRQPMSPVSVSASEERSLRLNRASSFSERRSPSTHTVALRSVSLNVPAAPAARRWLSAVDLHQAGSNSDGGALQHALLQTHRSAISAMALHVSQSAVPPDVQGWLQAVRYVRGARVDAQDAVDGSEGDLLDAGGRRDATEAELCPLMR